MTGRLVGTYKGLYIQRWKNIFGVLTFGSLFVGSSASILVSVPDFKVVPQRTLVDAV